MPAALPGRRKRPPAPPPPGSIPPPPIGPQPTIRVIAYGPDTIEEKTVASVDELADLRGKAAVTWIDFDGVTDMAAVGKVGEMFGLHSLAVEDSVSFHQRPKVDDYEDYLFIVMRMPTIADRLELEQVAMFVGRDFLISVQEHPGGDCFDPVRLRLRQGKGRVRRCGADYLAYALIDSTLDAFFPILETYSNRIEEIERRVVDSPDSRTMHEIHSVRHDLLALRHVVWPTREAVGTLTRSEFDLITQETRVFLRDCYDHAIHLIDIVDSDRELASALIDVHLSSLSARLNEVMKVLTLIATIFIPLSFVASLYGMNFDTGVSPWNMPELEWTFGYPFALGIMSAMALGMLYYFYRKGWLGSRRPELPPPLELPPSEPGTG